MNETHHRIATQCAGHAKDIIGDAIWAINDDPTVELEKRPVRGILRQLQAAERLLESAIDELEAITTNAQD